MVQGFATILTPFTIVVTALASLLMMLLLLISCLYCFKSGVLDEEEDKDGVAEKQYINRGNSVDSRLSTEKNGKVFWEKMQGWFSTSGESDHSMARQELSNGGRTSSASKTTLYDKSPIGTMTVNLVQPQLIEPGSCSSSFDKKDSFTSIGRGGHSERSRMSSSSYIPDAFKHSFDFKFEIAEDLPTECLGKLEFTTIYLFAENTLSVQIVKATDLPAMDIGGTSDPFVKCFLLPDRKRKLETKTRRKTLNPIWKERLSFEGLAYEKIKQRVLYLQVLDYDRFSRNDPIGEIFLPLHTVNLGEEIYHNLPLQECKGSNKRGELLLALCYKPIEGLLDVEIMRGRNMKPMDLNGSSGKKVEKKKTQTIKNTLNPNFSQTFTFQAPMGKLRDIQLEIVVMDKDKFGRNDTIGKIYLGHKSTGLEKQHWKDMLANVRNSVSQWHVLKI